MWEAIETISAVFLAIPLRFSAEHNCERKWKYLKILSPRQLEPNTQKLTKALCNAGYKVWLESWSASITENDSSRLLPDV